MPEGKKIELRISATGGAQAAAEINKTATGIRGMGGALLRMAGGPIGLVTTAVGLATAAFKRWRDGIRELHQQLENQETILSAAENKIRKTADATEHAAEMQELAARRSYDMATAIDQITAAQTPYNRALEKEITLLKQKQAAEEVIAQAKGQTEIDRADGDDVKQEETRQRLRREAQARELRQLDEERAKKQELLDRKEADLPGIRNEGENTAGSLQSRADEAASLARDQREIEIRAQARSKQQASVMDANRGMKGTDQIRAFGDAYAEKVTSDRGATAAANEAQKLEAEAKELSKAASEARKKVEKDTTAIGVAMQKLYDEINQLKLERDTKTQVFSEADTQGDLRLGRVRDDVKAKADAKQQREAQRAEKQRLQRELEARGEGLDRSAMDASGTFAKNAGRVGGGLSSTLEGIGKKLSDGTNEKEIAQLAAQFDQATAGLGGATIAAMREMLAAQQKLATDMATLRAQIKNIQ